MSTLLALVATILTSFLPIFNKYILRDARPSQVAWVTNAASLPILAAGTLLLTRCSFAFQISRFITCTAQIPYVDTIFVAALLISVVLTRGATLLSTTALQRPDASLVSPLLTFNPAFTLLVAWFSLDEIPSVRQVIGVAVVLFGAYLLEVKVARTGLLAPKRVLLRRSGTVFAVVAIVIFTRFSGGAKDMDMLLNTEEVYYTP